mmetsp:Transcript_3397/g.5983  ORF Transcript_3397/g.5983 Transcript_3397/m.5983 type:complete len:240 (-) Transcript_3397:1439-2158(-)
MLESQREPAVDVLFRMDAHAEVGVVAHAHKVPREMRGLRVVRAIPSATHDLTWAHGTLHELVCRHSIGPENPAIVPVIFGSVRELLLWPVNITQVPCLPSIKGYFHPGYVAPATRVGIAPHGILAIRRRGGKIHALVMIGRGHSRVDVEFVEHVFWLVPPAFRIGAFRVDLWRQDAVVKEVVVVVRGRLRDCNLLEPLDHSASNPSRDDDADWESVIWGKSHAVVFISDQHFRKLVHGE